MEFEIQNFRLGAGHRKAKMDGKDYLVVPMVMMTEGVHSGSQGPFYYPEAALRKFAHIWNMKPIVVYHPKDSGSACVPAIIDSQGIGIVMNARFKKKKLRAEAWIDVDKANRVDNRIMERLEASMTMEVSTGVNVEMDKTPGVWNHQNYNGTILTMMPDHLAFLPDQIGACSRKKGAGLGVLNSENMDDLEFQIKNKLEPDHGEVEIKFLTSDAVVFNNKAGFFAALYSLENDGSVVIENSKVQTFEIKTAASPKVKGKKTMEKELFVSELIANEATKWTEADSEFLNGLEEAQLLNMAPVIVEKEVIKEVPAIVENKDEKDEEAVSFEALLNAAPAHIQDSFREVQNAHAELKAGFIAEIIENKGNKFTPEFLETQSVDLLRGMAGLVAKPVAEPTKRPPMFAGQAPVKQIVNAAAPKEETGLAGPDWNFENK